MVKLLIYELLPTYLKLFIEFIYLPESSDYIII